MRDPAGTACSALRLVGAPSADGGVRLHTATLSRVGADGSVLELFHACRVAFPREVRDRLAARHGAAIASAAAVRAGVDPRHPIVAALLGAPLAERLDADGDLPGGALLGGGDLHVVQSRG